MRVRVPLGVPERRAVRERRIKTERQVMLHVRVSVLVDRDRAGRVRAENDRNAALNARLAHGLAHGPRDIIIALPFGFQGKDLGFHAHSLLFSCR